MVKRALTLLTSILFALPLLMPFNIFADTITTNNIKGINTVLVSKSQNVAITNSWYYLYEHTITLDANYIGTITLDINLTYYKEGSGTDVATISNKSFFVNGNSIKINQVITSDNYNNQGPFISSSYLLKYSNVYLIQDGVSWDFPIESLSIINQSFDIGASLVSYYNNSKYTYPIFEYQGRIMQKWASPNTPIYFILGHQVNLQLSNINDYLTIEGGTVTDIKEISYSNFITIKKITVIKNSESGFINIINKQKYRYIPIWAGSSYEFQFISTDFALNYSLGNRLIDSIESIAKGTTATQSAADSSKSANEQLQTDSNTLFNQEDNFKSDMQSAMQNVNNTFRLQDMGTKFVSSAQWVRTQYEQLTNNTPFASLITFSLITGLALILLGKVYK